MEIIRFFLVALLGVIIDISVVYFLIINASFPILIASIIGFIVALLVNYVVHSKWTFKITKKVTIMSRNLFFYLIISGGTLLSRLVFIFILGKFFSNNYLIEILILSAAFSFFINYFLSKTFIFSKQAIHKEIN